MCELFIRKLYVGKYKRKRKLELSFHSVKTKNWFPSVQNVLNKK